MRPNKDQCFLVNSTIGRDGSVKFPNNTFLVNDRLLKKRLLHTHS